MGGAPFLFGEIGGGGFGVVLGWFWAIFALGFGVARGALGPLVALFRTPYVFPGRSFCSVRSVMQLAKARRFFTSKRTGAAGPVLVTTKTLRNANAKKFRASHIPSIS